MFYRGSRGALVVFDLTRPETFEDVKKWIEDANTTQPGQKFILVGNKADLKRKVKKTDAKKLAKELNCLDYIETSAKTGTNVNDAFNTLGTSLM